MSKGFVYELNPTDYFFPFKSFDQAIVDAEIEGGEKFKDVIITAVDNAKNKFKKHTVWEGDGRFFVSGLPGADSENMPLILVIIKQVNNGTTFLYSPVELPYLEYFLES
ncbi:hypothetical protein [Anaeromusa sp.]|uniref:hypothetical protein n=1 Tax=Anaeromusa sp. TaxID=1872520 RepID=UPI0026048194|nr:hypothetical protein [Anaeromusa sp.]MDD3157451.1 hypothetical protein [Anaeromusa sp.]